MRKFILTFIGLSATILVMSQNITFSSKHSFGTSSNSSGVEYICTMTNNAASANDSNFKWTILSYNPPSAWTISFCDPTNCFASINVGSNSTFNLGKGKSGDLHVTISYNGGSGWDTLKVLVKSTTNSSVFDTASFISQSWKTGINEMLTAANVSFFPNPASNVLNIQLPQSITVTADIYNITGIKVKSSVLEGSSTMDIAELRNGIYFLRIVSDGKTVVTKTFTKN